MVGPTQGVGTGGLILSVLSKILQERALPKVAHVSAGGEDNAGF